MKPTPYPELNWVLSELAARGQSLLGENFVGLYLHGSLAVGDFDEKDSDVDFLIVINEELTTEQLMRLQEMHGRMHDLNSPWAKHLEGSYLPKGLLAEPDMVGIKPLWYLDNGWRELTQSAHDNAWVVFWILHHHGIAVTGPAAKTLFGPVPAGRLRQEVLRVMAKWGGSMLQTPTEISSVWYQSFAVMTFCRMLQTLSTGRIHSKQAGVRWAQAELDPQWKGLIQRAWAERPDPSQKIRLQPDVREIRLTLDFISYALKMTQVDERAG